MPEAQETPPGLCRPVMKSFYVERILLAGLIKDDCVTFRSRVNSRFRVSVR